MNRWVGACARISDAPVTPVGGRLVLPGHRLKARIDSALLALADLVHRRLHVVDAPAGHASEEGGRPCVRIEQHLVRLAVVRHQAEGATGRQFGVCLQAAAQPAGEEVSNRATVLMASLFS